MPRRVINDFSKGMVTDSIAEEGAVAYLQDMYLRKRGELISRGPLYANQIATLDLPADKYTIGYSASEFHPNFGLSALRAMHSTYDVSKGVSDADSFMLIGAGLQSVAGNDTPQEGLSITWQAISEGTGLRQCCHDVAGNMLNLEACYQTLNTGEETLYAGETGYIYKWGGSYFASQSGGTVSIDATGLVTGSGAQTWQTSAEVGQYILIDGIAENATSGQQRAFRITSIRSNTSLQVETPLAVDATARNYRIQSLAVVQSPATVWNTDTEKPFTVGVIAYHNSKLFVAGPSDASCGFNSVFDFDAIRWSGTVDDNSSYYSHMDLWHSRGKIRIMPGVGGFIRGLVSMGNKLVVIKSHGLFTVSGDAEYDGDDPEKDFGVALISSTIGALGFRAWKQTPAGLIMANDSGLWIYDGDELKSLTAGRIDNLWESFADYSTEFTVNTFGSLVTIGSSEFPDLPCVCWDMEKDYFFIGTNLSMSSVSTVYSADDQWMGHVGFAGHVLNLPQYTITGVTEPRVEEIPTSDLSSILHWNTDAAGVDLDASGVNVGPNPIVATLPIPLYDEGPGDGRVNNLGFTLYADRRTAAVLRPGESGIDQIVYSEHQSDGTDFGVTAAVHRVASTRWGGFNWGGANWGSSVIAGTSTQGGFVEEEMPLTSEVGDYSGGYKNVRVPVDSFPSCPFVSVIFMISENYAIDDTSYQVRLQAIYVDYEPTSNMGTM